MGLSKRSGTDGPTNLQSRITRCLGIDKVWIVFADVGYSIRGNCGGDILQRGGSGNMSQKSKE